MGVGACVRVQLPDQAAALREGTRVGLPGYPRLHRHGVPVELPGQGVTVA